MSTPTAMTNAEAAQHIARTLGPILPICYLDDGVCACGGHYDRDTKSWVPHTGHDLGKAPISRLVINGVDDATTNSATIDRWWRAHPRAGVGLALKPARKVFIDPDSTEALAEALALGIEGGIRRDSRNVGFLFNRQAGVPSDIGISKSADKTELEIQTFGYATVWGTHANGSPVRVDLAAPLRDTPAWAIERLMGKAASKAAQDAARAARRAERAAQGIVGDEPLWQLDAVATERWNGTLFEVDSNGNLDRSRSLYHLGIELANHGATEAGIRWAVENRDAALGWRKYTDRDDADKRYDEIAEKVVADGIRRGKPLWQTVPTEGSDGAEACRGCVEKDRAIESLTEHTRTYKAELELIRHGPVPTGEALALDHLVNVSFNARTRGEDVVSLYVPAEAKSAGVGDRTMTRALNQARKWQGDPETAAALHFRIEDVWEGGKQHVKLRALPLPRQDGAGWRKADEYRAIARLPRDEGRAQHGGARIACPKHPDAPLSRTRIWRCTEDECTWVHQDTAILGEHRGQDGAGDVGGVSEIHGEPYVTTVSVTPDADRRQDGANKTTTYTRQDGAGEAVNLTPVSFVGRDDQLWADSPNYWGEPPPDDPPEAPAWQPPPVAPGHHIAGAFRRLQAPPLRVAGGEE